VTESPSLLLRVLLLVLLLVLVLVVVVCGEYRIVFRS
jgi:hypothetical protein